MGKDYYKIMGVGKNATPEELKKAYKKLALKWHPDRVPPEKKDAAQSKFQEIGEAFDVLSDPEKKRIYDQVGEEGLKGGMPPDSGEAGGGAPPGAHFDFGGGMPGGMGGGGMPRGMGGMGGGGGGMPGGFHFSGSNADDIFRNFFGTSDPFAAGGGGFPGGFGSMGGGGKPSMGGMGGGMGGMPGGHQMGARPQRKAEPVHYPLNVSLEDLYSGATKKMRITSKRVVDSSGRTAAVAAEKEIVVRPGWKSGTKITFESEGDEAPGVTPADIIFTLHTKPHARFERDGDDLVHHCTITLQEAICGFRTTVTTLDNRQLTVEMRSATPDTVKLIPGEGMPNSKKKTKGDMKIKFKIVFPDLSQTERDQIGAILSSHHNAHKARK